MKLALLVFIIYIFVNEYSCNNDVVKYKPILYKNIKINNPGKFSKIKTFEKVVPKKYAKSAVYTVFNPIYEAVTRKVLGEPLIEVDQVQNRPRVKKTLGDYISHVVKKRSVDDPANAADTRRSNGNAVKKRSQRSRSARQRRHKLRSNRHNRKHKSLRSLGKNAKKSARNIGRKRSSRNKMSVLRKSKRNRNNIKRVARHKSSRRQNRGNNPRVGKAVRPSRRLIASKDARIEDYPYVVSIQKSGQHWCTGALLNQRLVITTANCIWKSYRVSRLKVRAGSRFLDRGGQLARIQEVMRHPDWSIRKNPDYDVGLILLDRNIRFIDSVHSVDLPNYAMMPPFDDAWVTSWGAERRDGIYEERGSTLQVFHTRLMEHDKCNNVTERFGVSVTDNFICLSQTGRRAPCTRDTGAPAVSDGILWGLASWGIRKLCGTERFPAMFSYLASKSNLDFITNATMYLMSDKRFYPYPDNVVVNRALPDSKATTTTLSSRM